MRLGAGIEIVINLHDCEASIDNKRDSLGSSRVRDCLLVRAATLPYSTRELGHVRVRVPSFYRIISGSSSNEHTQDEFNGRKLIRGTLQASKMR